MQKRNDPASKLYAGKIFDGFAVHLYHLPICIGATCFCDSTVFVVALWCRDTSLVCLFLLLREFSRMPRSLDRWPYHGDVGIHELLVVSHYFSLCLFIFHAIRISSRNLTLMYFSSFLFSKVHAFYFLATFFRRRFCITPLRYSTTSCLFRIISEVWLTFFFTTRLGKSALQAQRVVSLFVLKTETPSKFLTLCRLFTLSLTLRTL